MKATIISSVIALVLIGGAIILSRSSSDSDIPINNVSVVDGVQIVTITAKGGYWPQESVAQAGIPTILRIKTKGTFDCSSALRIPSMNISKVLPNSGTTDVNLGNPDLGIIQGTCGMGMYPFEIEFRV